MFEFLFGRSKKYPKPQLAVEAVSPAPKKNDIRLEMIGLALKSVLRRYGIPAQWIGCEIEPMAKRSDSEATLIQLVVLQWHDELMRYTPELQKQFLNEIHFFDSNAETAKFLVVWKFAPDCGCPNDKLPEAGFWASIQGIVLAPAPVQQVLPVVPAIAPTIPVAAVAVAAAAPAAKFDLPKSKLDDDEGDDGFPATQIFEQK